MERERKNIIYKLKFQLVKNNLIYLIIINDNFVFIFIKSLSLYLHLISIFNNKDFDFVSLNQVQLKQYQIEILNHFL